MAGVSWNSVNILFPSAASAVRIKFTSATATVLKLLLSENEQVLKLIRSEILQTETRVLYELLYLLNNSFRANKTFKGLQQVEQCINKLKNMKLCAALQDLVDLCPPQRQMASSITTGECELPSQPMLEWICLKVLGASKLVICTMARCSKAFILSKQQLKWEEFIILNIVITSMLSRLWAISHGILVGLAHLYQNLLELLKIVAEAQPMPYLTDVSLPADMAEFLGPSDAPLLKERRAFGSRVQKPETKQQLKKTADVKDLNQEKQGKTEDLGVSVKRDLGFTAVKPFFSKGKSVSQDVNKTDKKQKLKKQIEEAATFSNMSASLEDMIRWCKSQRMEKTKRLLTFLHLKCQRMKRLEATGHNMQRKLRVFRREVSWALSPQGSEAKTFHFHAARRRPVGLRSRLQSLKRRFMLVRIRAGVKTRRLARRRKQTKLPVDFNNYLQSKAAREATLHISDTEGFDCIDDIFASAGL
ncbi:nucleolus and neural progenitor protein [Austrofundulus limnaeus]|uniref:Nucleolus and neural progenitor protein n=1 Tax=Austrofundulus limnaeus TaxID=52670 RepID=A0A2I4BW40_AUSLI|nr:PREDICTED: uncharacterized protein C3orf17 homolog [Austrofundulus limnaeus]